MPIPWTDWSLELEADLDEALQGVYRLKLFYAGFISHCCIRNFSSLYCWRLLGKANNRSDSIIERFSNYDLSYDEEDAALNYLKRMR